MSTVVAVFAFVTLLSWGLGLVAKRILFRCGIIDRPNHRSSHSQPTIRGGGVAIIVTILASCCWLYTPEQGPSLLALGICILLLSIVSFVDDLRSIPAILRLSFHILSAVVVVITLKLPQWFSQELGGSDSLWLMILGGGLSSIWIVGYTNAFNFMDGINGIAGFQAMITAFAMGYLTLIATGGGLVSVVLVSFCTSAAALGFLPHNFPRARMFMGDVGSASLGFLLGTLTLWLATLGGLWLLVPLSLLHANFILDTTITLVRRLARGDHWHEAHREHFYQRLVRAGKSHDFVTGWVVGLQLVVFCLMLLYLQAGFVGRLMIGGGVMTLWFSFFAYCEWCFRRSQSPLGLKSC